MKATISGVIGIFCMILAVGAIDGPTGHENDNWMLCFTFAVVGMAFMVLTLKLQNGDE